MCAYCTICMNRSYDWINNHWFDDQISWKEWEWESNGFVPSSSLQLTGTTETELWTLSTGVYDFLCFFRVIETTPTQLTNIYAMECAICLDDCVYPTKLPCGHIFCFLCVKVNAFTRRPLERSLRSIVFVPFAEFEELLLCHLPSRFSRQSAERTWTTDASRCICAHQHSRSKRKQMVLQRSRWLVAVWRAHIARHRRCVHEQRKPLLDFHRRPLVCGGFHSNVATTTNRSITQATSETWFGDGAKNWYCWTPPAWCTSRTLTITTGTNFIKSFCQFIKTNTSFIQSTTGFLFYSIFFSGSSQVFNNFDSIEYSTCTKYSPCAGTTFIPLRHECFDGIVNIS